LERYLQDNEGTLLFVGMIAALTVAAILEVLLQRRPQAANMKMRWANNIGLALINQASINLLTIGATIAIAWWGNEADIGLFSYSKLGFWPTLLIAILVFEFISYWFHRALHAVPILWRLHAVHHSDTELDFTTTYRNHPLELYINAPLTIPVILLLGFPVAVVTLYQLLKTFISVIAHSNIRLPENVDRIIRHLIITPDYHRLHHCSDKNFTDCNFCAAFPLYDYLFRTAKTRPYKDHETIELGLEYFRRPIDGRLDRLLLMPFIWTSREKQSRHQRGQNRPKSASYLPIKPGPPRPLCVKLNSAA
jgi:sterol desaturase/sphingolipid hydroxylase (fatty acid hydroxylase superfamily)